MIDNEIGQTYFVEAAWNHIRAAWEYKEQGRIARAQQELLEARYYQAKIYPEFIDRELGENIDRIGTLLTRGYE